MKKIIGILGVAVIALTLFFSTNAISSSNRDVSLANLFSMNTADAECEYKKDGICEFKCDDTPNETCKGEATINGYKLRVTCNGKQVSC